MAELEVVIRQNEFELASETFKMPYEDVGWSYARGSFEKALRDAMQNPALYETPENEFGDYV